MGCTTTFSGKFKLNKKLDEKLHQFLKKLSTTRRMKRKLEGYGVEGEYYVDGGGFMGQDREDNILEYNHPPATQPSLWCQWTPDETGEYIEWDGGEKFYEYVTWLKYIVSNFLEPNGYNINGEVFFEGELSGDAGVICVENNCIKVINKGGTLRGYVI